MFVTNKCQCKECQNPALSVIRDNEIIPHEPGFCFEHTEDKIGHLTSLLNYINSHEKIIGLCAYGISVNGVDLSGKKFYGCNFQHSTFSNIHSTGLKFNICTLDFSTFSEGRYLALTYVYVSLRKFTNTNQNTRYVKFINVI